MVVVLVVWFCLTGSLCFSFVGLVESHEGAVGFRTIFSGFYLLFDC